jgi:hypothetical protein
VGDVRSVVALALLDERLRPDDLLGGHKLYRQVEHHVVDGVLEPLLVDGCDGIAGAIDHVHEVLAAIGLANPVRKGDLGLETRLREDVHGPLDVARPYEDVEVLGVALDTRVSPEGVRPTHQERHSRLFQRVNRVAVERAGPVFEERVRLRRLDLRQRCTRCVRRARSAARLGAS